MLRLSGYWLIFTCILHVVVGAWVFAEPLSDIAENGFFNVVSPDPLAPFFDREDAFWFMMFTPLLFVFAQLCFWAEAEAIILPGILGWSFLVTAIAGIFFEPISGLWLLIPPALVLLVASLPSKAQN